ncbi:MAG: hypothetical protein JNK85_12755 [Verrucomicrobiales bacterium]|nr:hypothetical protein [Verrucomicrobiales bacterium]
MTLQQWANNGWLKAHHEYDDAGGATKKDADELIEFTRELREDVRAWLQDNHIELLLPDDHT